MGDQAKAPRGGRKLKRIPKYRAHYSANYDSVKRNKDRRVKRFEAMVEESRERREGHGPYPGEMRRRARYLSKKAA